MRVMISSAIERIAAFLRLAYSTPKESLEILDIFRRLLENEDNFLDFREWGKKDSKGREIFPFSFTKEGLQKAKQAFSKYPSVYKSGVAGMSDITENLTYFLTQYLTLLPITKDWLGIQEPKEEKEKEIVESLRKKYKPVSFDLRMRDIYQYVVKKQYSESDKDKIKKTLLGLIKGAQEKFEGMEKLTPQEESYIKTH